MDISDKLIDLRILLMSECDGFSTKESCKNLMLSNKLKVLFMLSKKDLMPCELIGSLGMAKSNLANLLKSMIQEGIIESYKTLNNSRNVFYRITETGEKELAEYKTHLRDEFTSNCNCDVEELALHISKVLELLKGDRHD